MGAVEYHHENLFIRKSSIRYVFPPMVGMIFAQIAPIVDSICVANSMGEEALSAIGTVGPINYLFNIIASLGGIGCGVVISRCSGSGEKALAARVFTRALFFMVITTLFLSIAGIIFLDAVLKGLCATPENYSYAREYLLVCMAGAIFPVLNFAGDYILANDNNQTLAMTGDIVGAIVNMVIDFVGVFVFHYGIWVVAFGTIFGSFCCCLTYFLHTKKPDRLCRIVPLKRVDGDPSEWEILKPGSAEALMYVMYTVQLLIQNFVLRETAGTMGIGNSTVVENLQLIIAIIVAGTTDAIYPMAAAYCGEQNQSGVLMVKRMLTKLGFLMLLPAVFILCIFPQLVIMPYSINEPLMLKTLPFAIRLISVGSLIIFINTLLIDYLSAIEEEKRANIALFIQSVIQISFTLLLYKYVGMDAPWYAIISGGIASLVYLCFFCGNLPEGLFKFHQKNLLVMTGGYLTQAVIDKWKSIADGVLTDKQLDMVEEKLFSPLIASIPAGVSLNSVFTILKRKDGMLAVILRYESKEDYVGTNSAIPEQNEDETEFTPDVCIRSEFLGTRRLMIVLSGKYE